MGQTADQNSSSATTRNERRAAFLSTLLACPEAHSALRVLVAMMAHADADGVVHATYTQLAETAIPMALRAAGVAPLGAKTLQRAVAALEAAQLVERRKNNAGAGALALVPACLKPYNAGVQTSAPTPPRLSAALAVTRNQTAPKPNPNTEPLFDHEGSFSNVPEDMLRSLISPPRNDGWTNLSTVTWTVLSTPLDKLDHVDKPDHQTTASVDSFDHTNTQLNSAIAQNSKNYSSSSSLSGVTCSSAEIRQTNGAHNKPAITTNAPRAEEGGGGEKALGVEKQNAEQKQLRALLVQAGFAAPKVLDELSTLPLKAHHIAAAIDEAKRNAKGGENAKYGYAAMLMRGDAWRSKADKLHERKQATQRVVEHARQQQAAQAAPQTSNAAERIAAAPHAVLCDAIAAAIRTHAIAGRSARRLFERACMRAFNDNDVARFAHALSTQRDEIPRAALLAFCGAGVSEFIGEFLTNAPRVVHEEHSV